MSRVFGLRNTHIKKRKSETDAGRLIDEGWEITDIFQAVSHFPGI